MPKLEHWLIAGTGWATVIMVYLFNFDCQRQTATKEAPLFRIVAIDAGFQAPDKLAAGVRHIVFENRGSEIHALGFGVTALLIIIFTRGRLGYRYYRLAEGLKD